MLSRLQLQLISCRTRLALMLAGSAFIGCADMLGDVAVDRLDAGAGDGVDSLNQTQTACAPGSVRCQGSVLQACEVDGSGWSARELCASAALCGAEPGERFAERQAIQCTGQRLAHRLVAVISKPLGEGEDELPVMVVARRRDGGEDVVAVELTVSGQCNDFEHVVRTAGLDAIAVSPVVEAAGEDIGTIGRGVVVLEIQDRATEAVAQGPPKCAPAWRELAYSVAAGTQPPAPGTYTCTLPHSARVPSLAYG